MDERYNDLKAKNTRMVQVQVDHAKEMILLKEQLGKSQSQAMPNNEV
jgi:hypothetical protein